MNQKIILEKHICYKYIQRWLFIYVFCYALFHIVPAFLEIDIHNRFTAGDLFDLFTPFLFVSALYKLYAVLRRSVVIGSDSRLSGYVKIILVLGSVSFIEGHGMHLSANAIARHLIPDQNSPLFTLDYFFDEVLGHLLWDSGIVLMSIGIMALGFNLPGNQERRQNLALTTIFSLLYGFTYFVNAVEGQTVMFTFPLAIIISSIVWWLRYRKSLNFFANPVLLMFAFAYLFAVILFFVWGAWHRGFPQFSELGLI